MAESTLRKLLKSGKLAKMRPAGSNRMTKGNLLFCRKDIAVVTEDTEYKGEACEMHVARCYAGGQLRDVQLKVFVKPVDGTLYTKRDSENGKPIDYFVTIMGFYAPNER